MKENKNFKWLAVILAGALAAIAVYMGAIMTYDVMGDVIPNNPTARMLALAFFDGGAIAWAGMYIYLARGSNQRAVSFWMMVYDLAGVVAMVIGAIFTGGQTLVDAPPWLAKFIVDGVIVTMTLNLVATYYYHIQKPEVREAVAAQELEDTLTEQAEQQARATIEREAQHLGALLAGRVTSRIKYRMRLPMSEQEEAQWRGEVVDGDLLPQPALPAPAEAGISLRDFLGTWLKSFFTRGRSPQPVGSVPTTTTPNSDSNSNDEPQPEPAPND
jgi:hypothetical protein